MAKIFLDTNIAIDILGGRRELPFELSYEMDFYISVLSIHIIFYVRKSKIPDPKTSNVLFEIDWVDFNEDMAERAMMGPTTDFEDNVQLHSAVFADADVFITRDAHLQKLGYFGKVQILSPKEFSAQL